MLTLLLLAAASGLCSALPQADFGTSHSHSSIIAKRFVNIQTSQEQEIQRLWRGSRKGRKSKNKPQSTISPPKRIIPTYPESITNPVDPNSWLMQYAQQPDVYHYWNYSETLWAPCQRHRQPIPDPATCVPSCEDIHSHTHLALFTECGIYAQICTFATFALPDEQCPDRVNSYTLRCPDSLERLNKIRYYKQGADDPFPPTAPLAPFANVTAAIEAGTLIKPSDCPSNSTTPTEPTESSLPARRSLQLVKKYLLTLRNTITAHINSHNLTSHKRAASHLLKRAYTYRTYLDSMNLYRIHIIQGPSQITVPVRPQGQNLPFNCHDPEQMVQVERIWIGGEGTNITGLASSAEICWYPATTRDHEEERCPGIKTPADCPKNENELLDVLVEYYRTRPSKGVTIVPRTREEVRRLLQMEREREVPRCYEYDGAWCGAGPNIVKPVDDVSFVIT
ncbi:hypothetical protein BJ508DRAFT_417913 [Ascobolus immersus RN42]|uniref:Uncharacterized protein n=1 Tax=Ascobolus immersus RN42 TaxID=1160509 RepID=A0A3N4HQ29_ASCIM|nr:hypothetical protein BJ508DRAFT_417913 [Ascobolus immersus RN42]